MAWVKDLHPEASSYTDVYDRAGLLSQKTVMAHCVHLTDCELETLKSRGVGIAHCANSNNSLRSGNMDIRRVQRAGVKVGLGTDCSAGYAPSLLDAIR